MNAKHPMLLIKKKQTLQLAWEKRPGGKNWKMGNQENEERGELKMPKGKTIQNWTWITLAARELRTKFGTALHGKKSALPRWKYFHRRDGMKIVPEIFPEIFPWNVRFNIRNTI